MIYVTTLIQICRYSPTRQIPPIGKWIQRTSDTLKPHAVHANQPPWSTTSHDESRHSAAQFAQARWKFSQKSKYPRNGSHRKVH
jgi:hypothetical protein